MQFGWRKFRLQEASRSNALRRFKREVRQEDFIKEVKLHSFYLKPSENKRLKEALARKRSRNKHRKQQELNSAGPQFELWTSHPLSIKVLV